jgi:hypothetical protein
MRLIASRTPSAVEAREGAGTLVCDLGVDAWPRRFEWPDGAHGLRAGRDRGGPLADHAEGFAW